MRSRSFATFAATFCVLFLVAVASANSEIIFVESKDVTSRDIPLEFELQKTTWKSGFLRIWGRVKNVGGRSYSYVSVSFAALDKDGRFLGRYKTYCNPHELDIGQVGYIDSTVVDTEKRKPTTIEVKVTGR